MAFKVQPNTTPTLCRDCDHAHVIHHNRGVTIRCTQGVEPFWVTHPVQRCNEYHPAGQANQWEMEKIAWTLNTSASGQRVGFSPPKKEN